MLEDKPSEQIGSLTFWWDDEGRFNFRVSTDDPEEIEGWIEVFREHGMRYDPEKELWVDGDEEA